MGAQQHLRDHGVHHREVVRPLQPGRRAVVNASRNHNLSTTSAVRFDDKGNIPAAFYKHKEKQKAYRVETGEMIYLKAVGGGRSNVYLFGFTCLLTAYLCFESCRWFYIKSWPEKKE